ncbi:MAG: asparagine synthase (glutamine-hydrolyzing) [Sphingobacteriaceae bacterium]|nr:asparagine synthase (glutamine-hydrolyzing) [Sphingobacteriaceae bacterium]
MCGILAYFNRNGISEKELKQSLNALQKIKHRGPDGEGVVLINTKTGAFHNLITAETPKAEFENKTTLSEAVGLDYDLILGHRRLSIIDVSTNGHQPMHNPNGNWIVFNGEIYNYLELREELKLAGFKFKTDSDTEVIHTAYQNWGSKCLEKFNGMFTIVLFDAKTKNLFVANDRYGVKPLYYINDNSKLLFVSEIKQVKEYDFNRTLNKDAVDVFLKEHYINYNNETFYNEVKRHSPAHFALINVFKDIEYKQSPYYQVSTQKTSSLNLDDAKGQFGELLQSAVNLRMRSDVPVGFASSGGLDSSAILYTAHQILTKQNAAANINTFSAIFPGDTGDESYFIKLVENDLKVKSYYVNPMETFTISDFEKHIYHQDEPVLSTAFYAGWSVSRLVRQSNVTVLLVGQGADEILAGYHHHFYRYGRQLILSGKITTYLSELKKYAALKGFDVDALHRIILNDVKLALKFKLGLAKTGGKLADKWNKAGKLIELLKMDLTETMIPFYLRADDRNSMAFHVEARHPFLDYRLVDFCFTLPDNMKINEGWQKYLMRETLGQMPNEIRYRKDKKGYTTPQDKWLSLYKQDFEGYLNHIPADYKLINTSDIFLKYALGAWFKVSQ